MTISSKYQPRSEGKITVAVVGAGPGGLAAAINLIRLLFVELSVYDQARELREVGAGISIQANTWRLLQLLGAADKIEQYISRGDGSKVAGEQRNGHTGELLSRRYQTLNPHAPPTSRIERHKLQKALLSQIPPGLVQLSKRLAEITESSQGVKLSFQDGTVAGPFDLLIGADGLRSVVRQHAFPDHRLSFTGKVAYRTLIPQSAVAHIPDIPEGSVFWHTRATHVYTHILDDGLFEIATRALESEEEGNKVSWGQKVTKEKVIHHYQGYCETVRKIIAAPDDWLEFALFGGPRLESVISNGRVALLGDASHPLSGAFGSGAAFAFEDAYVLAQALTYAHSNGQDVAQALRLYDGVRSPHYRNLYTVLNSFEKNAKDLESISPPLCENDYINERTRRNWDASNRWIYQYNVADVWQQHITTEDVSQSPASSNTHTAVAPRVPEVAVAA